MSGRAGDGGGNGGDDNGDYEVGYGKPPKHRQFMPGQSGNPKGRPRGARGKHKQLLAHLEPTTDIILEEAYALVPIREGGRAIKVPAIRAVAKATIKSAATGGQMAQKTFTQSTQEAERRVAELNTKVFETLRDYKLRCERERRECRAVGLPEPDFLPCPDDIFLNWYTLTAEVRGPTNAEEKAALELRLKERDAWEEDFVSARQIYEQVGRSELGLMNALISQNNFDIINLSLPERYQKELKGRLPNPGLEEALKKRANRRRRY